MLNVVRRTYQQCRAFIRLYNNRYISTINIFTREPHVPKLVQINQAKAPVPVATGPANRPQSRYEYARRFLVDNVLKRVTSNLNADLRRRSTRQLLNGNPSPFFALVGVSLASGTGYIRREDEFEGVLWEIRHAMHRMRQKLYAVEEGDTVDERLESLEFGSIIAKGCNAVVYEARKKAQNNMKKCDDSINAATDFNTYPLAVKMMFNYDAESNAYSILRSMYREMVPLYDAIFKTGNHWEEEMFSRIQKIPPHVNIVKMYQAFADYVPELRDSKSTFPDALPRRLNPDGYGRNMSLFLVMKKYNTNLKQYLIEHELNVKDGIMLFCQLLEAITHMQRYSVAHRDLKADNILLDTSEGPNACPLLVVTDFGCCLADKQLGLKLPYKTPDINKGGNPALMAPEVLTAQCGMFSSIDYSKSDIWTAGTIAYEIFTKRNPFYRYRDGKDDENLCSSTYTDDMLPILPDFVPPLIANVVYASLMRNPAKRLDAETAATICQLYLWAPKLWLEPGRMPSNTEVLQWLLTLSTKVLYEGPLPYKESEKKRTAGTEYELITTFLQRAKLNIIKKAMDWIQDV